MNVLLEYSFIYLYTHKNRGGHHDPLMRGQRLVIFGPSKRGQIEIWGSVRPSNGGHDSRSVTEHVLAGQCFRSFLGEWEMKNKSEFNKKMLLKLANYFTKLKCFKKITKRQYINRDPHRFKANK